MDANDILGIVEKIQAKQGNFVPRVARIIEISKEYVGSTRELRKCLNENIEKGLLSWGFTPYDSVWFATKLRQIDYIALGDGGWTIEYDINKKTHQNK